VSRFERGFIDVPISDAQMDAGLKMGYNLKVEAFLSPFGGG